MLSKERYEAYRDDRDEIERLRADTCEVSDTVRGSSPEPPYTQHTIIVRGVDQVKLARNQARIEELEARCAEVDAEVALAPESVRLMLSLKYQEGMTWAEVGAELGRDKDACRIAVQRFFQNFFVK